MKHLIVLFLALSFLLVSQSHASNSLPCTPGFNDYPKIEPYCDAYGITITTENYCEMYLQDKGYKLYT